MKHSIIKYLIVLFVSFISVESYSLNTSNTDVHPQSINIIAAQLMSWYGRLLPAQKSISFNDAKENLDKYLKFYPDDIKHVEVISSKIGIRRKDGLLPFNITTHIYTKKSDQIPWKMLEEQFFFKKEEDGSFILTDIIHKKFPSSQNKKIKKKTDRMYYKSREIAYSWLAYMDGFDVLKSVAGLETGFKNTLYSIEIGSKKINNTLAAALDERANHLYKGQHTLRSIDIKNDKENPHFYILDLMMDWKGFNVKGVPVVAKIHQKIKLKLNKNGSFEVISIIEKHLIPDLTPWQDLLC